MDVGAAKQWSLDWHLPLNDENCIHISFGGDSANSFVMHGRTKDVILIERVQRAARKMVAGLKSMDYETRLVVRDLFLLEYRRLRGDLILTYALFEQSLAERFFHSRTSKHTNSVRSTIRDRFMRVLTLANILSRAENRCKSEIRQWNIRKQAAILDLARKNRNVLFKYITNEIVVSCTDPVGIHSFKEVQKAGDTNYLIQLTVRLGSR
ncbi:pol-related protein [Clonorchis sinensis]|uniref:Pol-related protein n=1 Tax=Clonorchis sinensis TaxID=79923 RepID=G7YIM8_CLOSI|nr:pol-related protein [Clonorchis sinensis]